MAYTIEDGANGYKAKVDSNNRLRTLAISEGYNIEAAELGENYNITTGAVTLTSGNESAVLYIKNNEDKDLIIVEAIVVLGNSTGGSGDVTIEIVRNPTAGTIVSGATDVDVVANRNFGSSRALLADAYKGAEGNTMTGGTTFANTVRSSAGQVVTFDADVVVLPKGASGGIKVTPQSGNTSMDVRVAVVGFLFERD